MTTWRRYFDYEVHADGRVRRADDGNQLHQSLCHGYPVVHLKINDAPKRLPVHRLVALTHIPNPMDLPFVDHMDHDKTHSHVSNLRWATAQQNQMNRSALQGCGSKYKGVRWHTRGRKWQAQIKHNGLHRSRLCDDEVTAARLYDTWARELFKEFAWLNADHFPEIRG